MPMKMARATAQDIEAVILLRCTLENMLAGYLPHQTEDDLAEFDSDRKDHLEIFYRTLRRLHDARPGAFYRVLYGMEVLCDPENEVIDQNERALELHPSIKAAQAFVKSAQEIDADYRKWGLEINQPTAAVCALTLAAAAHQTEGKEFIGILHNPSYNGVELGDWEIHVRRPRPPREETHGDPTIQPGSD